jgi:hypothetical protein
LSGKNLTEILHEGESAQLTSMLIKKIFRWIWFPKSLFDNVNCILTIWVNF